MTLKHSKEMLMQCFQSGMWIRYKATMQSQQKILQNSVLNNNKVAKTLIKLELNRVFEKKNHRNQKFNLGLKTLRNLEDVN